MASEAMMGVRQSSVTVFALQRASLICWAASLACRVCIGSQSRGVCWALVKKICDGPGPQSVQRGWVRVCGGHQSQSVRWALVSGCVAHLDHGVCGARSQGHCS